MTRFLPILIAWMALLSCESEQVLVDRIVHDTVWVKDPPIKVVTTVRDTVYITEATTDTIVVTKQIVTTDTVFLETPVYVIDTVFQTVVETKTIIEVDTVLVETVVEHRLAIVNSFMYSWDDDAVVEWLSRVDRAGLELPSGLVTIDLVDPRGPSPIHTTVSITNDGSFYEYEGTIYRIYVSPYQMPYSIWRGLSAALLGKEMTYLLPEDDVFPYEHPDRPEYDHIMSQAFNPENYTEEKQDWYWNDMFGLE